MADRRRVTVIGLGGTIAMGRAGTGGVTPALSAEQVLASVPDLEGLGVAVEAVDFRRLPGAAVGFDDLVALAALIRERLGTVGGEDAADRSDGVVVVQGTDTIEETSYLLDLYHAGPEPVVVTGAMRNPTQPGADGPANLLAAVATAADPGARGLGCLVVLADEIHAARRVRKGHSTAGSAFGSPNGGPLGYLVERRPRLLSGLADRTVLPVPQAGRRPRVALLTLTLDDDGILLDGLVDRADGVVVAGFGVGHAPERLVPALHELADRVPVVLASRTGAGPVLAGTYGFAGSERDLIGRGLIPAGFLHPVKARILLWAALAAGAEPAAIRAAFGAAGGYRDPSTWPWFSRA